MARPKKEEPNHGTYYEIKSVIKDPYGNSTRKSFYSEISKADARRKADEYKIKSALGRVNNREIMFSVFSDQWLETCKADSVAANTYQYTYKNSVENHLKPFFQNYAIGSIRIDDVQRFFNNKKGCSESLLNKLKITLNAIFERAISKDLIYKNPCKDVVMPKSEKVSKTMRAYSADDVRMVVDYAKTVSIGNSIIILLKTGLRRGELLGLRWIDVDMESKTIHVRQAVSETSGVMKIGPPKTVTSIRDIPFDDELLEVLKSIPKKVTRYKGKKEKRESYEVLNDYVIPGRSGGALLPTNWQCRIYDNFMEDFSKSHENIPKLNAHELRHTYGTRLYKGGTDIYTISKLMGHANVLITTKIYVHNDIDTIRQAIKQDW